MVSKMAMKVAECLIDNGIINESDKVIYQFGAESLLMNFAHYLTMELIGWLMGVPVETAMFIILYKLLRVNAGGHHFENPKTCFASSCLLVILTFLPMHFPAREILVKNFDVIFTIEVLVIFFYSPCDNHNKLMNNFEKRYYKKRTVILLVVLCGIYFVCHDLVWKINYVVIFSMFWESIGLVVGTWKNKCDRELELKNQESNALYK